MFLAPSPCPLPRWGRGRILTCRYAAPSPQWRGLEFANAHSLWLTPWPLSVEAKGVTRARRPLPQRFSRAVGAQPLSPLSNGARGFWGIAQKRAQRRVFADRGMQSARLYPQIAAESRAYRRCTATTNISCITEYISNRPQSSTSPQISI